MFATHDYLFFALMFVVCTGHEIPMFGVVGRSVRLPCNIPIGDRPMVEWSDMVWTSDANRSVIFRSDRNPQFEIHAFHQNANDFLIDNDFALTIQGLDIDADPGQYTCRSVVDGDLHERHYYLTVGELPSCSGAVLLSEGQSTTLECEMTYSGQQPLLQWFRGGQLVQSEDQYDIRLARKVVTVEGATETDDGTEYACRMSLGDTATDCTLTLNVTYLVRDIRFHPEREKFRVGDELKCSARGNPSPRVSLLPKHGEARTGRGWQSVVIGRQWEGQRVTVQCSARNSVGGGSDAETISSNLTFHVTEPKRHTTPIARDKHQNMHSARQTATPPTVMRKEKEQTRPAGNHKKQHHHHLTTASGLNAAGKQPVREDADDIEQHDRIDSNRNTGARSVQSKSNEAGHMKPPQLIFCTLFTVAYLISSRILN